MTTPILTPTQGQILVKSARFALMDKLGQKPSAKARQALEAELTDPCFDPVVGVFVTLKLGSRLRGCIGSLEGYNPLGKEVRRNALKAAFEDLRFRPLGADELERLQIEVSILTPPKNLNYSDTDDLLGQLRPGIDGVILRKGMAGATFLPQVWEQLPQTEDFLSQLCLKAGLSEKTWQEDSVEIETYQVQSFEEPVDDPD